MRLAAFLVPALFASALAGSCDDSPATGSGGSHGGHGGGGAGPSKAFGTTVSSTLALSEDGASLFVVNPDADSISVIDTKTRSLTKEALLGGSPPAVDPITQRFEPAFAPRAPALSGGKIYVAAQAKNAVIVLDAKTLSVSATIAVGAAPVSVVAKADGSAVYVVSHEAASVSAIDPATDAVVATLTLSGHPWGASVSPDGKSLFVTHLLLDPGISVIDTATFTLRGKTSLAAEPPQSDKRVPNGVARGAFSIVPRPKTGELWVPYLLLAVETPQPDLDFESTVFPTLSLLANDGSKENRRLLFQPPSVAGAKGSFSDPASGPHAMAFTPDGKLALVAFEDSEDVMVLDAETGFEKSLVRPLPSTMLEGIVVDREGKYAYVDGRNTHDVTVLSIDETDSIAPVRVDGAAIERLGVDPMPAELRLGQRLFYTANSAAFPVTQNFWVACATCHIEGGSDAVTWLFRQGPRDTPTNAGGPSNTGFMMRQALRNSVTQYDETIRIEQGGHYDRHVPSEMADLDALAAFVNRAIPYPSNPNLAASGLTDAQHQGEMTFLAKCASCHSGAYLTDSAEDNPGLDLSKNVPLHDVGTCVKTGAHPDQPSLDVLGNMHTACDFDTPSLRAIFATPPYFHDGSAATLQDVVDRLSFSSGLDPKDKADLVLYLETL